MQKIVGVIFSDAGKVYYYDPGKDKYQVGDYVVVETASDCALGKIDFVDKEIDEMFYENVGARRHRPWFK